MDYYKVLIADGSSVYRQMITQGVKEVNQHTSVVCVTDSDEAIKLIKRNDYDVIVIDAEIPGPGLFELLNVTKLEIPKALVLVTARPSSANEKLFPKAVSAGATACMIKPIYDSYRDNLEIIKRKITDISKFLRDPSGKETTKPNPVLSHDNATVAESGFHPGIVLIAASTGGPIALETIITQLRKDFPVPILVVQHIPSYITENLAQNLNQKSKIYVKVAEDRETISPGTVYFAPGGAHMKLDSKNKICLDDSPPRSGVRPAADVLFESVAEKFAGSMVLTVLLTGMGSDGKDGLVKLKEKKICFCLVQSEKTCVVYGMPRAAVEEGLADKILDLDLISSEIEGFDY